jgi:metal-sulfur cluster biosynthetic enzyme
MTHPRIHTESSPVTDVDLREALRDCYDSRFRRNIVDMNLVRSATLRLDPESPRYAAPRSVAHIHLTAPSTDEAATSQLVAQIENRLLGLEAISRVEIHLEPALFAIL